MGTEWGRVESDGDGVGTGMTARERGRNGEKLMVMGWEWGQKILPCHSLPGTDRQTSRSFIRSSG